MSGSGITPINSGPLVIRTYLDGSANNAYILGKYDYPVSSNYVLITSENGVLAPSDNIYISSIGTSSFRTSTLSGSTIITSSVYTSSLVASTVILGDVIFSSINGYFIQGNTIRTGLISVSSTNTHNLAFSTFTGSSISMDYITVNSSLTIRNGTFNIVSYTTINGSSCVMNAFSTNSISTNSISTNFFVLDSFYSSTLNTNFLNVGMLSTLDHRGTSLAVTNGTTRSSIITSSIVIDNLTFDFLLNIPLSNNIRSRNVNTSSLSASSLYGSTMLFSSLSGNVMMIPQVNVSKYVFSTFAGSTATISSINASTFYVSTLLGTAITVSSLTVSSLTVSSLSASSFSTYQIGASTLDVSSIIGSNQTISSISYSVINGSTIITSTSFISNVSNSEILASTVTGGLYGYSTMTGNRIITPQLSISVMNGSIMIGSTMTTSSLFTSTIMGSTLFTSSIFLSSLTTSTMSVSTLIGGTIFFTNGLISTVIGSTFTTGNILVSTLTLPSASTISLFASTLSVSTLYASTINNVNIASASGNTSAGYLFSALTLNTSGINNTALGYNALTSNTSGSHNTGLGASTLATNTTGSYNTAIGTGAGLLDGFSGSHNTYIGYNSKPSGTSVTNEIVVGGSASAGGANIGNGNNSVTVGNPSVIGTRLNGSVGIGTNAPQATLDVRGSYQQIGGNMFITNNAASSFVYVWLYNDSTLGGGWFLNSSGRAADGGGGTATIRNDYGSLRIQGAGGYNNTRGITILENSGNVGINSGTPANALDVVGSMNVSGTATIATVNCTGVLQYNGSPVSITSQWGPNGAWTATGSVYFTGGNVGIGTATPNSKLSVYGSVRYTSLICNTMSAAAITCGGCNTTGNITAGSVTCGSMSATGNLTIGPSSDKSLTCRDLTINNNYSLGGSTYWTTSNVYVNLYNGTISGGAVTAATILQSIDPFTGTEYPLDMSRVGDNYALFMYPSYRIYITDSTIQTPNNPSSFGAPDNDRFTFISAGFQPGGGITASLSSGNSWSYPSDLRIKNTIISINTCIHEFLKLNPVTYYFKEDSTLRVGFIAQEVKKIFPLLVKNGAVYDESDIDEPYVLSLASDMIVIYIIKAIQDQHAIVKQQKALISELQTTYQSLQSQYTNITDKLSEIQHELALQEEQITLLETSGLISL